MCNNDEEFLTMDDWKPQEYWKRVICIIIIRAGFHIREIVTAAQWSLSTVKMNRDELETCEGKLEDVACQMPHMKHSGAVRSPDFVQELQNKALEDPGKVIRSLVREKNVRLATMKLFLNAFLRHSCYKRRNRQLLTARAQEDHLKKARKLLNKPKRSEVPGTLGFFSEEKNFCQHQLQIT